MTFICITFRIVRDYSNEMLLGGLIYSPDFLAVRFRKAGNCAVRINQYAHEDLVKCGTTAYTHRSRPENAPIPVVPCHIVGNSEGLHKTKIVPAVARSLRPYYITRRFNQIGHVYPLANRLWPR